MAKSRSKQTSTKDQKNRKWCQNNNDLNWQIDLWNNNFQQSWQFNENYNSWNLQWN
jgi:hypothetical protein